MNATFRPPAADDVRAHDVQADEFYPWSVVNIGGRSCEPRHLTSGETGPRFDYTAGDAEAFKAAYDSAEQWIRHHIATAEENIGITDTLDPCPACSEA